MSEIDVRRNGNEMVDRIRFSENGHIECFPTIVEFSTEVVEKHDVPNLIKALQKYMELYGER